MKNIKLNAFLSLVVRVLNIVFPLITGPYIARILNKADYGYFNTANAYLNFFIPFATFGVYNYGIRTISKIKEDKKQINKVFSQLFYISLACTIVTTIIYLIYVKQSSGNDTLKQIFYILAFQLFAQAFYIEWMNEAFENYGFILYKTLFIRIVMLVSIFMFVKKESDIIPYVLVMTITTILNYLSSFIWIKKDVKFVRIKWQDIKPLISPLLAMLLLANANMMYTFLDRLFISQAPYPEYISYYTISQNIVMLIAGVVSGAVSVSVPRLGYYLGKNNHEAYTYLVNKGSRMFNFFIVPISFGLTILGPQATLIYAGAKYTAAGICTSLFAMRTIVWALEIILGTQVIFVNGFEKKLTLYATIGGISNLILNYILYINHILNPEYYILTTIIAEAIVVVLYILFIYQNNLIKLTNIFKYTLKYMLVSASFFVVAFLVNHFHPAQLIINKALLFNTFIIMGVCSLLYICILYVIKDITILEILESVKKIWRKICRKKLA